MVVCPACRGELAAVEGGLACGACRVRYPIVDGVARLAADHAVRIG
ncbi:MAG: Trm112 family protein [Myxococcota bacterium]